MSIIIFKMLMAQTRHRMRVDIAALARCDAPVRALDYEADALVQRDHGNIVRVDYHRIRSTGGIIHRVARSCRMRCRMGP